MKPIVAMMMVLLAVVTLMSTVGAIPFVGRPSALAEDKFHGIPRGAHLPRLRSLTAPSSLSDDELIVKIRSIVSNAMSEFKVPGVSLSVIHKGVPLMAEGFGFADLDNEIPVTNTTLFQIGSTSKAFTAAACLSLVDDGAFSLDQPIRNFYPQFQLDSDYATNSLTTRDVLSHRSGMPRHDSVWVLRNQTSAQFLSHLRYLKLNKLPRYSAEYNNWGFVTAGEAAAAASGMTWSQLVQQRILDKLAMNDTYPTPASVPVSARARMAIPYASMATPRRPIPRMLLEGVAPAGSIVSNAVDMQKWMMAWLQQWVGSTPVLSQKAWVQFRTPLMHMGVENPTMGAYALGTLIEQYRDTKEGQTLGLQWHDGQVSGMSTSNGVTFGIPGLGSSVFISANQDGSQAPRAIFLQIIDLLYPSGRADVDWNRVFADRHEAEVAAKARDMNHLQQTKSNSAPSLTPAQIVGTYSHPAYGEFIVARNGSDGLTGQFETGGAARFEYWGYTSYLLYWQFTETVILGFTFVTDASNRVVSVYADLDANSAPISFTNQNYTTLGLGYKLPQTCHASPYPLPPIPPTPVIISNVNKTITSSDTVTLTSADIWTIIILSAAISSLFAAIVFAIIVGLCKKRGAGVTNEPF